MTLRFKLQTDYAVRAILYLAAKQGANCTTEEIAGYYRISAAHLGRVIRRLQKHGFVKAIRGRKGGVRLDRDPATVTIGQVVDTLEGAEADYGSEEVDGMHTPERLRAVLRRAQGLFLNYLRQVDFGELGAEGLPPRDMTTEQMLSPAEPAATSQPQSQPTATPSPVLTGPVGLG